MLEEVTRYLWQGASLPEWDARRCFLLFRKLSVRAPRPATRAEREEYAKLLLRLVALQFQSRDFVLSLPRAGVDPLDAAQEAVTHLLKKTPTMRIRVLEDPDKPEKEQILAMLGVMNVATYRRVMTLVSERASKVKEACASDAIRRRGRDGEDDASVSALAAPAGDEQEAAHARLAEVLADAEDQVLRGVPGEVFALIRTFRLIRRLLLRGEATLTSYQSLPPHLLRRIAPEEHALILSRTVRLVESAAAN